jgi:hypothetical protein
MITHDLRAYCDDLRRMVTHGINPTPHELLTLATRLEHAAAVIEEATVFAPSRVVDLARGLSVIEGGLS